MDLASPDRGDSASFQVAAAQTAFYRVLRRDRSRLPKRLRRQTARVARDASTTDVDPRCLADGACSPSSRALRRASASSRFCVLRAPRFSHLSLAPYRDGPPQLYDRVLRRSPYCRRCSQAVGDAPARVRQAPAIARLGECVRLARKLASSQPCWDVAASAAAHFARTQPTVKGARTKRRARKIASCAQDSN